ncbi:FadR/GntR family transcriptional regulator [Salidesulfovibrio onnuriiensis]|uniref:FadR/GntR family transcriptional regulator n=1 Tax=Salidesulfovibrio onnuriiensis TaxID=2583823 RepID=UPI0011C7BC41|nr:FadR/GntR family transcriptional regulator [Salidesulfovibrio onnuriiensis]
MPRHQYQVIVDRIKSMIENGEFSTGDRIPPERSLAQTFSVSRNCVREAIRALAEKGILESRLGDGTYVRSTDQTELSDHLAEAIQTQKQRIREIFELRMLLEPQIASLAAERISPDALNRLKAIVLDQGRAAAAGETDAQLDALFHQTLAEAAGNGVVLKVMDTIKTLLEDTRSEFMRPGRRKGASVEGHLQIIEALENRNPLGAYFTMTNHIKNMESIALHPEGEQEPC